MVPILAPEPWLLITDELPLVPDDTRSLILDAR